MTSNKQLRMMCCSGAMMQRWAPQTCYMLQDNAASSVPYKNNKVQKVQNFFRHFHTEILRIPAFFLLPKTSVFVSRQKP